MKRTREDRVSHAKRLFLAGKPLKDIAKLTTTKAKTIESWASRGNWRTERDALRKDMPTVDIYAVTDADRSRLASAAKIYYAVVEDRAELCKQWVARRAQSKDPANVLSYTGQYSMPSDYERLQFCEQVQALSKVINDRRVEIDALQSTAAKSASETGPAGAAIVDPPEQSHLRAI